MNYIKCAVNSSLLTLLWLLQKVCGTLGLCFIRTHNIHKESVSQMYFGVIFHKTKHHALAHITSGAFIHCALSLAVRSHDFACQCLLWRLLSSKICLAPTLGLTTNLVFGLSWLFSASSINFLTRRSLKSLSLYLAPHKDNSIQLLSTFRYRGCKIN